MSKKEKTGNTQKERELKKEELHEEPQNEHITSQEEVSPLEIRICELESQLDEAKKTLQEEKEAYLRKMADMDNYRKRMIREKEQAIQYANERLLSDLIPILDDFDRAVDASEQATDLASYAKGVLLIQKQLLDVLHKNWGLKRMEKIEGKEFSPHEHEAMMMEESDQYEVDTVLAELQKGYYLHDRVLRTAKVKVGKAQ